MSGAPEPPVDAVTTSVPPSRGRLSRVVGSVGAGVGINAGSALAGVGVLSLVSNGTGIEMPAWASWWLTGSGVVLAGLLVGVWLVRRRVVSVANIVDALHSAPAARDFPETLVIAGGTPESDAWNELVRGELGRVDAALTEMVAGGLEGSGGRSGAAGPLVAACDALSHGLVVLDSGGLVSYANGAASIYLSRKRADLVRRPILDVLRAGDLRDVVEDAIGGAGKRTVIELDRSSVGDDADAPEGTLRFHVRPLRSGDSTRAVVLIEDITQQRVADEANSRLVAHATHELRTPLTNIRLYVEEMLDSPEDAALRSKGMNVVNGEVRRLERVISEMLSVSELEAGSFSLNRGQIRVDAVLDELRRDYAEQAAATDITLEWVLPPKMPVLSGDREKLAMAMHNLIGNALKYTPAGGTVTITVTAGDDEFVVEVADTGIGIASDELEHVFDRFYRAKDKRVSHVTGTGLGLTLAREVVRLHGGDIDVSSEIDRGSRFRLSLPAVAEAA